MISFKHKANIGTIGSGDYKFRHYGTVYDYLCFTASVSGSMLAIILIDMAEEMPPKPVIYYSFDKVTWTEFEYVDVDTGEGTIINFENAGDKVWLKGDNETLTIYDFTIPQLRLVSFEMYGGIYASGNIMSLLDSTCSKLNVPEYCFYNLFGDCGEYLLSAPDLPATQIGEHSYSLMFKGCSSLIEAPDIPALTIPEAGCAQMFKNCTGLESASALSAISISENGCESMFEGCTSLTDVPNILATTVGRLGFQNMFRNCSSLVSAPEISARTVDNGTFLSMFENCTSLVNPPSALYAETIVERTYFSMFYGCNSLINSPHIKATAITGNSLAAMFRGCRNIETVKIDYTGNFDNHFANWLYNTNLSGILYYNGADRTRGPGAIPEEWTVQSF